MQMDSSTVRDVERHYMGRVICILSRIRIHMDSRMQVHMLNKMLEHMDSRICIVSRHIQHLHSRLFIIRE